MTDIARRRLLAALAAAAPMSGCAASANALCPRNPAISDLNAALTIDVHAHIFNGCDLQIREFISQTVVGNPDSELYGIVRVLGGLLQHLTWSTAPTAQEEHDALTTYARKLLECEDATQMRRAVGSAFQDGYDRGRRELQVANQRLGSTTEGAAVLSAKEGLPGLGLAAAIQGLPPKFEDFEQMQGEGLNVLRSQPHLMGYVSFVLHHFNHRHVNAIDYLTVYSTSSPRKIDLLTPSMVDFDWWLARGQATKTTLAEQVDLMSRISVLTAGRVHGFVSYCPFREVATSGSAAEGDAIQLVKRAIETEGFIGVKLYPPMGFAPWGNAGLSVWKGKRTLPDIASQPGFGKHLDVAMGRLFKYCLDNDVPILAHANRSNGPYEEFKDLAGSAYWEKALNEFIGLKVCFGHFGDTDLEDHDAERSKGYVHLMSPGTGSAGERVFADSGYFSGVLTNQTKMTQVLRTLLAAQQASVLRERLMYGTDWTMILPQVNVERYLAEFIGIVSRVEQQSPSISVRGTSLSNAFFGGNAVAFLGLSRNQPARKRLESFYARKSIETPDWMHKIG